VSVRTGVWLYPDAPVGELVDAVVRLDDAGIDEVWIADEGVMRDPIVVLAAAACRTTRIRMGVGITSPALRHAGAIASTVASLDELSGGRAMLGFGVGGQQSLGPFGLHVERPVALVRDALSVARAVLGRVDGEGYSVTVHAAPARDVPLYVASRGEQINTLASRVADGVFLSGFAPDELPVVLDWVRREGAPTVALYQSVRFATSAAGDPTSVAGAPAEIVEVLESLVDRHRPDSIGLALVDGAPVLDMLAPAIETLNLFRRRATR
jgi:alkanesulfonate monooxygenase SsuD/methylene tetrahydromethanopterin reductase-like flavin-dependent oxidoreductase (luciferase family)